MIDLIGRIFTVLNFAYHFPVCIAVIAIINFVFDRIERRAGNSGRGIPGKSYRIRLYSNENRLIGVGILASR